MDTQNTGQGGLVMAVFQPVVFRLGKELYGINISYVNAIENAQQVVRVPNASSNIKGIINLRGEVIPVVNLRAKFNVPDTAAPGETELVIINLERNKIALEVDGVEEIHNIDAADIADMPVIAKGMGVEYFESVAKANGRLIIMINPHELLSEDESRTVDKLTESTETNN